MVLTNDEWQAKPDRKQVMATVTDSAYDMDEKARISPAYKSETVKPRAGTAAVAGDYL